MRKASNEVVHAYNRAREASALLKEAKASLAQAKSIDASADREAIAVGKPLSDHRAADAANEALEKAQRRYDATRQTLSELNLALARTVHGELPTWRETQGERIAELQSTVHKQCDELLDTLNAFVTEDQVSTALASFPEGGSLVTTRFVLGKDDTPTRLLQPVLALVNPPAKPKRKWASW